MNVFEESLALHKHSRGKLEVASKVPFRSQEELSLVYTPGVAGPCEKIAENQDNVYEFTAKGNMVAVISDGSAVLGLGNIGPEAAIPVMEGKALLFKGLANIDAIPLCLATQDTDELVKTIEHLAPSFGAINLEDIAAPRCFEVEARLKERIDIPVFHDDQHGTAICVLAGLINAHKVVDKNLQDSKIVINGAGAAGIAIGKLLLAYGAQHVTMVDRNGMINRQDAASMLNDSHAEMAQLTNHACCSGSLAEALIGADVFIGVSRPGLVTKEMVATMQPNSIVFAMANPTPEIFPDEAKAGGAAVVGTGRPDFPNMINNVLAFPGVLKGALAVRAADINQEMNLAAAVALADSVPAALLSAESIFPHPMDEAIPPVVAAAVALAARRSGVARLPLNERVS